MACMFAFSASGASCGFSQKDVGRAFARDRLRAFIAQGAHIDVVQEILPGTEQDGSDGEMQLVDQAGAQILPNRGYAAAEADVAAARRGGRLLQSGVKAFAGQTKLPASPPPVLPPPELTPIPDMRVIRPHLLTP